MSATAAKKTEASFYPLNLSIAGTSVLMCGGGKHTLAEIARLIDFGAQVDIVSPHVVSEIDELADAHGEPRVRVLRRHFSEEDEANLMAGKYSLVFAMYNRGSENTYIKTVAREAGVPACLLDNRDMSDFLVPSIAKRGHLKITVSTDGISPTLEKAVLQRIEASLVNEVDKYVLFLRAISEKLDALESDPGLSKPLRLQIERDLAESEEIFLALRRQSFEEAKQWVDRIISEARSDSAEPAGRGD